MTDNPMEGIGVAFGEWVDTWFSRVAADMMRADDATEPDPVTIAHLHAAMRELTETEAKFGLVAALMVGGAMRVQIIDMQHDQVGRELHHFETEQQNAELRAKIANHVCEPFGGIA